MDRAKLVHYSFDDIQDHVKDFNPDANSGYGNIVCIASAVNSNTYTFPVSYFLEKMPIPEPFVRFGYVGIAKCEDEFLIEFLRNAKDSFAGCSLRIGFHIQKNFSYLLANVLIRPAKILIDANPDFGLQQILRTQGVSNCNKMKLFSYHERFYTQEMHCALLDWLQNDHCAENKLVQNETKILVLENYPEKMILSMVEHLRQVFKDDSSPSSEFLIGFIHAATPNLDGEQLNFSLSKVHTGEKLSFFKGKDIELHSIELHRLWRRRVINKRAVWMMEWQYKNTNIYQTI